MTNKKKKSKKPSKTNPVTDLPEQTSGEVKIIHEEKPSVTRGHKIYDMPAMPPVPEGKKRKDKNPDDELNIDD